jgi:hypothetical protein
LCRSDPTFFGDGGAIYATGAVPELDMEKVIYFATSVFWRASVHSWRRDNRTIRLDLGSFEKSLRLFLFDDAPFPSHMVLHVWVASLDDQLCATLHLPESGVKGGIRTHQFAIPGITFELMVGTRIPTNQYLYSTAPAPERFVGMIRSVDIVDLYNMARQLAKVRSRQGLR